MVRDCVVSLRVFSQHCCLLHKEEREASCLHFQFASEIRYLCWTGVSPLSVTVSHGKCVRGNGRWQGSRPGSGFCGSIRMFCFHSVLAVQHWMR